MRLMGLWFLAWVVIFVNSAQAQDLVVLGWERVVAEKGGESIEQFQFHVYDSHRGTDYNVQVAFNEDVWAGSNVSQRTLESTADFGSYRTSHRGVDELTTRSVLNTVESFIHSARAHEELRSQPLNPPAFMGGYPDIASNTLVYTPDVSDYDRARFQIQMQRGLEERFRQSRWNAQAHQQQQQMVRQMQERQRNVAMQDIHNALARQRQQNSYVQAQLLYMFYIASLQSPNVLDNLSKLEAPSGLVERRRTEFVQVSEEGVQILDAQLQIALDQKNWREVGRYATQMYNPWTGGQRPEVLSEWIDENGILKGPAFRPESIDISRLKQSQPQLAYQILKTANALQAYALTYDYFLVIPSTRDVLLSAGVLLGASTHFQGQETLAQAEALVSYFTGVGDERPGHILERSDGRYVFSAEGRSIQEILASPEGASKVAQASYHAILSQLNWVDQQNSDFLVERSYGPAVDVQKAVVHLVEQVVGGTEWLSVAAQDYLVSVPLGREFTNPDLQDFYQQLTQVQASPHPQGQTAINASYGALQVAQDLMTEGQTGEAQDWLDVARVGLDVALGFIPVVSTVRDTYELVSGRHLLTGEDLTINERLLAGVSLLTAGTGSSVFKSYQSIKEVSRLDGVPVALYNKIRNIVVRRSDRVNAELAEKGYTNAPYLPRTRVQEYELAVDSQKEFVRVFTQGQNLPSGRFIVERRAIEGLSPQDIARKLELPHGRVPTHIADVNLPAGTQMRKGLINYPGLRIGERIEFQHEILTLPKTEWFQNIRGL